MVDPGVGYVDIASVAKYFSVSISTVRAWIRTGVVGPDDYLRLSGVFRFKIADVEAALRRKSDPAPVEPPPVSDLPPVPTHVPVQLELDFGNPDQDL